MLSDESEYSVGESESENIYDESGSDFEVDEPVKKPAKKPAAKRAASATPPARKTASPQPRGSTPATPASPGDELGSEAGAVAGTLLKKLALEQYQKLSPLEHILKRPDTYIGLTEQTEMTMWVFDEQLELMAERSIKMVPGLFKIFDEILVNAADNKIRDPLMKLISVSIDAELNTIEVKNDGRGIPVEMHLKEHMYIPELIFGNLLTLSNYDDDEKKVTGGRNGYGAKLCNIFSTEFTVETVDKNSGKMYTQTWRNNMGEVGKPKIKALKLKEYTKITFKPDLSKFNMDRLDEDILGVMRRRVYDLCGTVKDVAVLLNGNRLKVRNFKQYVEMYVKGLRAQQEMGGAVVEGEQAGPVVVHEVLNERWEVAFAVLRDQFRQVSFVNSIATTTGGTHVNFIANELADKLREHVLKTNKKAQLKPIQIKSNMFVFVNCLVENPAFTLQTKEELTTRVTQFGGKKPSIPDTFVKKMAKTEIVTMLQEVALGNAAKKMAQSDGSRKRRITAYSKLEDANKAGTKDGFKCTLILTEGDSAKTLAVAGMLVVGRDLYGCFPLRGKMLNVRELSADAIAKNAEIQAIKQIMGLVHHKRYTPENVKDLRYGHIMIMTDQDHDGLHIKGLIINFLENSFPGLLEVPGFLVEFITPIVRVTVTVGRRKEHRNFYTMPEFEQWRDEVPRTVRWVPKYLKGLGSSSADDAREYFQDLDRHLKEFHALQQEDKQLIDLAFSKKRADDRKQWLKGFVPGTFLDNELKIIPITEFVNKELILFLMADNVRLIPSVLDGLKPGQRKVLYIMFKRNDTSDVKVMTLVGDILSKADYHHGDASLTQTIIGLAQDFVGLNNIHMLNPNGGFGLRALGGKDAAAARYIYTELNKITKSIMHPDDLQLLRHVQADESTVEPEWYLPVVPMVLVNGADGIGTGWSTQIPSFNPLEIVANIRRLMNQEEPVEMMPWYRGWEGTVERTGPDKYRLTGKIEKVDAKTLVISELPIRMWTLTMKEFLLAGMTSDKGKPWIKDMTEDHGMGIKFTITLTEEEMRKLEQIGLLERFKLVLLVSLNNMVAFDEYGKIHKYDDVLEILRAFYFVRLHYYGLRKDAIVQRIERELAKLLAQARFVKMIVEGELKVLNRKRMELVQTLRQLKFPGIGKDGVVHEVEEAGEAEEADDVEMEEEEEGAPPPVVVSQYDYLLGMAIWLLTRERYERLLKQRDTKQEELVEFKKHLPKDLWNQDLDAFVKAYGEFMEEDEQKRAGGAAGAKAKKGRKKAVKKKVESDDEAYEEKTSKKRKQEESDEEVVPVVRKRGPRKVKTETPKFESVFGNGGASDDDDWA